MSNATRARVSTFGPSSNRTPSPGNKRTRLPEKQQPLLPLSVVTPMTDAPLRLEIEHLTKTFPGVKALNDMSLSVRPGEVHALLGENGAGKSTLLRTMSGVMKPNSGTIAVDGHVLTLRGPLDARRAGIAMIHQELQQVRELTVAQNMFLGRSLRRGSVFVDSAAQEKAAAEALSALDPTIRPDAQIKSLKVAQRQIVEIGRALLENARIIAMDEPTSSLSPSEFERLAVALHRSSATSETVLSVNNLTSGTKVIDASFELRRGEVLGIAGLIGAGRTELLRLIAGADKPTSASITLNGQQLTERGSRAAIAAGIGLAPEERKREGIIPQRSVVNNVALPSMKHFAPRGFNRVE